MKMSHIESGATLRKQIGNRNFIVKDSPGYYCWWFPEKIANCIINQFATAIDTSKIQKRNINNETFWALYFGISKDMKRRGRWHIKGPFKSSTFRRSLRAILLADEKGVDDVIDQCYWEWDYCTSVCDAEKIETKELSSTTCIYPLNIDKNIAAPEAWIKELKGKRAKQK